MISKSSKIHPSAKIGQNVTIGEYCYIGPNAIIADHSIMGNHNYIEAYAQIGEHSQIGHHNILAHHCKIGSHNSLEHFNHIGSEGFGYAQNTQFISSFIPQLGNVQLGKNIQMGSRNCIDRAAFFSTQLADQGRITNHCHIAHNCKIDTNFFIGHCFVVAGSTEISKNFTAESDGAVGGHTKVISDITLKLRAIINSSNKHSGELGGFPAIPIDIYNDNMQIILQLNAIEDEIKELFNHAN